MRAIYLVLQLKTMDRFGCPLSTLNSIIIIGNVWLNLFIILILSQSLFWIWNIYIGQDNNLLLNDYGLWFMVFGNQSRPFILLSFIVSNIEWKFDRLLMILWYKKPTTLGIPYTEYSHQYHKNIRYHENEFSSCIQPSAISNYSFIIKLIIILSTMSYSYTDH